MAGIVWGASGIASPSSFKKPDRQFDPTDVLRDTDINTIIDNINFVSGRITPPESDSKGRVFGTNNDTTASWLDRVNVASGNNATPNKILLIDQVTDENSNHPDNFTRLVLGDQEFLAIVKEADKILALYKQ